MTRSERIDAAVRKVLGPMYLVPTMNGELLVTAGFIERVCREFWLSGILDADLVIRDSRLWRLAAKGSDH